LEISKASPDWIMGEYIEEAVAKIREHVGDEEDILGFSGGVCEALSGSGESLTNAFDRFG
jgi:GMP synthase (glutamine-hydrolysing)